MTLRSIKHFMFGTLRGRLILGVAAVHAVMMTLFVIDLTVRQRAMLLDRQTKEALVLSQTLSTSAAGWIAADDIAGLQEIVDAQRQNPELLFAMLTDEHGRVLAHTDKSKRGFFLFDLPNDSRLSILSKTPALVDAAAPAMLGDRLVGWARIGIGQGAARKELAEITFNGALYAFAAILIGSFIAWLMGRRITWRLYAVQETINKVRMGERKARSVIAGTDEAASLAAEFNALLDTVEERSAALVRSEERIRLLLQNIRVAVVVHGPDTGIRMSNSMAQELLGLSEEQMLGKAAIDPAWQFLREDGSTMPLEEYPVSRTLATRGPLKDLIVGVCRPHREEITWTLVNTELILYANGVIGEVIVTFVDISMRKRAEEEICKLNEDLEKRVAERTEDLQGKSGELKDNQTALMNIVEDLNEKTLELERANSRLKELDQLKSMFIASMSHELRTPLNSILGFSSILLNEWAGPLTAEQKENIAAVHRSGTHLLALINDVIDVSKIEAGKIESIAEDFDIHDVVMDAVGTMKKDVEKKGLELKVRVQRQVLHADRRRLLQCLLNLVSNAVKFTKQGSIDVYAELSTDGSMMTVTVEDTGLGIREEDLGRLFSPFVRLPTPMEGTIPGTGLGLYLTKRLVQETLRGDICVTSIHGAGSRFTLCVPVAG